MKYHVFENIRENGAFALWSKYSIFHNISKVFKTYSIFFRFV